MKVKQDEIKLVMRVARAIDACMRTEMNVQYHAEDYRREFGTAPWLSCNPHKDNRFKPRWSSYSLRIMMDLFVKVVDIVRDSKEPYISLANLYTQSECLRFCCEHSGVSGFFKVVDDKYIVDVDMVKYVKEETKKWKN